MEIFYSNAVKTSPMAKIKELSSRNCNLALKEETMLNIQSFQDCFKSKKLNFFFNVWCLLKKKIRILLKITFSFPQVLPDKMPCFFFGKQLEGQLRTWQLWQNLLTRTFLAAGRWAGHGVFPPRTSFAAYGMSGFETRWKKEHFRVCAAWKNDVYSLQCPEVLYHTECEGGKGLASTSWHMSKWGILLNFVLFYPFFSVSRGRTPSGARDLVVKIWWQWEGLKVVKINWRFFKFFYWNQSNTCYFHVI